jgi:hypothetical protein
MFTKFLVGIVVIAIGAGVFASGNQDQKKIQDRSKFMKRKLDASREIIAGLSMENYEQIGKSAQDLMLLSHEADWNVIQTEEYLKLSREFRDSSGRLRENAKKKNLDGSTLSFFEVTLNCVRCHKYVRQNKDSGK